LSGKGFGEERGKSLGRVPKYKLEVTTKKMIRWCKENRGWWKISIGKS
jgi:dTDP-D-glucose 4,6-dehydratase